MGQEETPQVVDGESPREETSRGASAKSGSRSARSGVSREDGNDEVGSTHSREEEEEVREDGGEESKDNPGGETNVTEAEAGDKEPLEEPVQEDPEGYGSDNESDEQNRKDFLDTVDDNLPEIDEEEADRVPPEVSFVDGDKVLEDEPVEDSGLTLTKDMIKECGFLSQLGRSADGLQHVFLCFSAVGRSLSDVYSLSQYPHLQIIDLENNSISDMAPLQYLPHVVYLNLGHNRLTSVLDGFPCPPNLRDVNLSSNRITSIRDLSDVRFLNQLFLDDNRISEISGLDNLRHLKLLSLRNNRIEKISGLEHVSLKELYLTDNKLSTLENIGKQKKLELLDVSNNSISSLEGVESLESLQILNIQSNSVASADELKYISQLKMLRRLDFSDNAIQSIEHYRPTVIMSTYSLATLDKTHIAAEEKVGAANLFHPPSVPVFDVAVTEEGEGDGKEDPQSKAVPAKPDDPPLNHLNPDQGEINDTDGVEAGMYEGGEEEEGVNPQDPAPE